MSEREIAGRHIGTSRRSAAAPVQYLSTQIHLVTFITPQPAVHPPKSHPGGTGMPPKKKKKPADAEKVSGEQQPQQQQQKTTAARPNPTPHLPPVSKIVGKRLPSSQDLPRTIALKKQMAERESVADCNRAERFLRVFGADRYDSSRLKQRQKWLISNPDVVSRLITVECGHDQKSGPHFDVSRLRQGAAAALADLLMSEETVKPPPNPKYLSGRVAGTSQADIRSLVGTDFERRLFKNGKCTYNIIGATEEFIDFGEKVQAASDHATETAVEKYSRLACMFSSDGILVPDKRLVAWSATCHSTRCIVEADQKTLLWPEHYDPLEKELLVFPYQYGGHWLIVLVHVAVVPSRAASKKLRVVLFDPMIRDSYRPSVTDGCKIMIMKIGTAVRNQCRAFEKRFGLRHRVYSMSAWILPASGGFHQDRGGPCGRVVITLLRFVLEKRPMFNILTDEIETRGPVFGMELALGCMLPLGYCDRPGGIKLSEPDCINDDIVKNVREQRKQVGTDGVPLYVSPLTKARAAPDWAAGIYDYRIHAMTDEEKAAGHYQLDPPTPLDFTRRVHQKIEPPPAAARMKTSKPPPRRPPPKTAPNFSADGTTSEEDDDSKGGSKKTPAADKKEPDQPAAAKKGPDGQATPNQESAESPETEGEDWDALLKISAKEKETHIQTLIRNKEETDVEQETFDRDMHDRLQGVKETNESRAKVRAALENKPRRKQREEDVDLLHRAAHWTESESVVIMAFKRHYDEEAPQKDQLIFSPKFRSLAGMSAVEAVAHGNSFARSLIRWTNVILEMSNDRVIERVEELERDAPISDDVRHDPCHLQIANLRQELLLSQAAEQRMVASSLKDRRRRQLLEIENLRLQRQLKLRKEQPADNVEDAAGSEYERSKAMMTPQERATYEAILRHDEEARKERGREPPATKKRTTIQTVPDKILSAAASSEALPKQKPPLKRKPPPKVQIQEPTSSSPTEEEEAAIHPPPKNKQKTPPKKGSDSLSSLSDPETTANILKEMSPSFTDPEITAAAMKAGSQSEEEKAAQESDGSYEPVLNLMTQPLVSGQTTSQDDEEETLDEMNDTPSPPHTPDKEKRDPPPRQEAAADTGAPKTGPSARTKTLEQLVDELTMGTGATRRTTRKTTAEEAPEKEAAVVGKGGQSGPRVDDLFEEIFGKTEEEPATRSTKRKRTATDTADEEAAATKKDVPEKTKRKKAPVEEEPASPKKKTRKPDSPEKAKKTLEVPTKKPTRDPSRSPSPSRQELDADLAPAGCPRGPTLIPDADLKKMTVPELMSRLYGTHVWATNGKAAKDFGGFNGMVGGSIEGVRCDSAKSQFLKDQSCDRKLREAAGYSVVIDVMPDREELRTVQRWGALTKTNLPIARVRLDPDGHMMLLCFRKEDRPPNAPRKLAGTKSKFVWANEVDWPGREHGGERAGRAATSGESANEDAPDDTPEFEPEGPAEEDDSSEEGDTTSSGEEEGAEGGHRADDEESPPAAAKEPAAKKAVEKEPAAQSSPCPAAAFATPSDQGSEELIVMEYEESASSEEVPVARQTRSKKAEEIPVVKRKPPIVVSTSLFGSKDPNAVPTVTRPPSIRQKQIRDAMTPQSAAAKRAQAQERAAAAVDDLKPTLRPAAAGRGKPPVTTAAARKAPLPRLAILRERGRPDKICALGPGETQDADGNIRLNGAVIVERSHLQAYFATRPLLSS